MDRDSRLIIEALANKSAKPVSISHEISTKLFQAYYIVKNLIETLDKTPAEQTPYHEMALTHLVNLEESLKELDWMLKDRMIKKSENEETVENRES